MKSKLAWTYFLVHFLLIGFGDSTPNEPKPQVPDKSSTVPAKDPQRKSVGTQTDVSYGQVSTPVAPANSPESDKRELRRRRSKSKDKGLHKSGYKYKSLKKIKKQQKKERKRQEKLREQRQLEEAEDKGDGASGVDDASESDDSEDRTKKYWDYRVAEPEYLVTEWFAVLDGKKFDKDSSFQDLDVPESEKRASSEYLMDKESKSDNLAAGYSSGWKYRDQDDDKMDYVNPVFVSSDALLRTFPDTKEDEVENQIVGSKFGRLYKFDDKGNFHRSPFTKARRWRNVGHMRYVPADQVDEAQLADAGAPLALEYAPSEGSAGPYVEVPSEVSGEGYDQSDVSPSESGYYDASEDDNVFSEYPLAEEPYEADSRSTRNTRLSDSEIYNLRQRRKDRDQCRHKVQNLRRKYEKLLRDAKKEA